MTKKSNSEKVFYAIAQLLNDGEKNITRYKVAQKSGVEKSSVYSILKKHTKEA